ncbi:efflux RND transporter periplasmic adaptor subunit [Pedomonas mirosovicensis]|uniref:efflux RND transporter periplasmic adaptor subunit n=1 Tax=Pedomonas mirosovicensis TaxID=2908641 RepID=UPI00216A1271|nr:efflux RND transporter periplasmic adaptor subunit [Pedomonas mirosovicensis]MCH8686761.1 efflux RND transporter periplasmic adaptor subunit [Pedomonas mirosovicensis]
MPTVSTWRIVTLAPLALTALVAGCNEQSAPPPSTVEVGYVTVETGNVTVSTELPGRTNAFLVAEVRPQVTGIIQKRLFEEGGMVKAGQPLYQIDPAIYEAAVNEAQAQLVSAKANLAAAKARAARYETLKDSEAVSRQDIDDALAAARQAEAAVKQAEAQLETARINLAYTKVAAPISGRIGRSAVTAGALVTASQADPLAIVQQLDPIYVDITQSSAKLLDLRRSLAKGDVLPASAILQLKLEDGTDYPLKGKAEFAETIVDPDSGTVTIRARFPNPDGLLLPGMFVRVIAPQAVVPGAVLAPQQGVTRDPKGNATALVVTADNKVERRDIVTGQAIGDKWLVTKGLKAGDRLIVEGTDKVRAGQPVKPVLIEGEK